MWCEVMVRPEGINVCLQRLNRKPCNIDARNFANAMIARLREVTLRTREGQQVPAREPDCHLDIFSRIFLRLSRDIKPQAGLRYLFRDDPENMIVEVAVAVIDRSATESH
jgi:hypothetical protein